MTRTTDFEGRLVVLPVEPSQTTLRLRGLPIQGVEVVELPPDQGWQEFDFEDTVPVGLVP